MQRIIFPILCVAITIAAHAQNPVNIDITGRGDLRIPIAVPPFVVQEGLESVGAEMHDALVRDLEFSGEFKVLPPAQYPPTFRSLPVDAAQLNMDEWRGTQAESIVHVKLLLEGDRVVAECRLFDLESGQQAVGKMLRTTREAARQLAHKFSDVVVLTATGIEGSATSRIAFSAQTNSGKEIFVADYDGQDVVQITRHGSISIKPKFSPDGRHIAYTSFKDRGNFLYVHDLVSGESRPLSKRVGMNSAPGWAPDGKSLALSLSKDGNPEIYTMNIDGSNLTRVTAHQAVDTSPTFSPDGQRIAFVSERVRPPQIYVVNADGSGAAQRLSYQGGGSYDPVWSPDGKWIAYVGQGSGEGFQVYILNPSNPRQFTRLSKAGRVNESPSWSPDSRHVVFASNRRGRTELWTANITSGAEAAVPVPMTAEGPSWGPRRH